MAAYLDSARDIILIKQLTIDDLNSINMGIFKKQKLENGTAVGQPVVATKYEQALASLQNFPSSIINGVTAEGGLYSLTFKSVNCTSLVENWDLVRKVLFAREEERLVINEDKYDAKARIATLKQEIDELSQDTPVVQDKIGELQNILQQALEQKGSADIVNVINSYEQENPNKTISFSNSEYTLVTDVVIPDLKVDRFEDVANPDLSAYDKETPEQEEDLDIPVELED